MTYSRYAIYYTPAPGPLADFGAAWLGWDIATGTERPHPDIPGLPEPVSKITKTPRKYGFHATIKPPFRLAPETTEADLSAAAEAVCAGLSPVTLDGLRLARIGHFLALVPEGDTAALSHLAATMVKDLDHFRAPADEAELTRRRARGLSPRQEEMLTSWGYPYVLDEFRFHMTLSGGFGEDVLTRTIEAISPRIDSLLPSPFVISDMSLVGERPDGRLEIVRKLRIG